MNNLKDWRKIVLLLILVTHACWISYHLTLVARGAVNPWKMGGYAMYTKPSSGVDTYINVIQYAGEDNPKQKQFAATKPDTRKFYRLNWELNLYCKPITPTSLVQLFIDNPILVGEDLLIEIYAYRLQAKPLQMVPDRIATVEVIWQDQNNFKYRSVICGQESEEKLVRYR